MPNPVMAFAIEPKAKGDEEKVFTAAAPPGGGPDHRRLRRQTGEQIVARLTRCVEVIVDRMKERFGAEVTLKPPRVPYLETIKGSAKARARTKQTGGRGQFADCQIEMEPLEQGGGFEFVNAIKGGVIPGGFIPAVEEGHPGGDADRRRGRLPRQGREDHALRRAAPSVDSSRWPSRSPARWRSRTPWRLPPVLMEPIMTVSVLVPEDAVGDVIGGLNSRRGRPLGMEPKGGGGQGRGADGRALGYAPDLRAITAGRGEYSIELARCEEVPSHLAQQVVDRPRGARGRRGLTPALSSMAVRKGAPAC